MHALQSLIAYYNHCRQDDLYREVIRRILLSLKQLDGASIYELADLCHVSPTTISRLSRRLGYRSFSEFRMDLAGNVKNHDTLNRYVPLHETARYGEERTAYAALMRRQMDDFWQALDDTLIDRMVECSHAARRIRFYTFGVHFAEPHFQEDLLLAGHDCSVHSIPTDHLQDIETLDEDSLVVLIVPVVAEGAIVRTEIDQIRERRATLLILTDSRHADFLGRADLAYCFDGSLSIVDDYRFAMFLNLLSMTYRSRYLR